MTALSDRIAPLLARLYPDRDAQALAREAVEAFGLSPDAEVEPGATPWSERDAVLIVYGDTLTEPDVPPLRTLRRFAAERLAPEISAVHVLPFFPWSSDDGFAVIDLRAVDPALGDWADIEALAGDFRLMADLVINHVSSRHAAFEGWRAGDPARAGWFIEGDPSADLSAVARPRPQAVLQPFDTHEGERHVWCTFSPDQIDLNFAEPAVLMETLDVLRGLCERGARIIRLDAVAYLWKRVGTSCIHLPETHAAVKLIRALLDARPEPAILITETNVPEAENRSYFGDGDEAHAVYNFTLPPLTLHALLTGDATRLRGWLEALPPAPPGCARLNFLASHDGIGVRGAEGLLSETELSEVIEAARAAGGEVSSRATPEGERPYEINVSLWSALTATAPDAEAGLGRFLCAHALLAALPGVPAFYVHSLLATPNAADLFAETGRKRSLNRARLSLAEVEARLTDPDSASARVLGAIRAMLAARAGSSAFHPEAETTLLASSPSALAFRRRGGGTEAFCLFNLGPATADAEIPEGRWRDLLGGPPSVGGRVRLAPWRAAWLAPEA